MPKIKLLLIALLLVFSSNTAVFANEEATPATTTTPSCPASPEDLRDHSTELAACNNKSFVRPISELGEDQDWRTATNLQRTNYCNMIQCLDQKRSLALSDQIFSCTAASANPNDYKDNRCQNLSCSTPNEFYSTGQEKIYDTNNNCKIDEGTEKCQSQIPEKINQCNVCKSYINDYLSNPNSTPPTSVNIPALNSSETANVNCSDYIGVVSCQNFFSCEGDSSAPALNRNSEDERIPFGTEFFNVNDPTRGLNVQDPTSSTGSLGQQNFTTSIEGGPIIGTINTVANFLVRMISVLSLIVFIIGAFLLIIANGEENQLNRGKDAIKLSLLGIVIVMLSYTIVVLVQSIFF